MNPASHVLVVDDDAAIRRVLSRYLTQDGFTVVEVDSGQAALNYSAAAARPA